MADRIPVPAEIKRAVLVEAGHRCAIPTCRATTTEIAHITPWSETRDNSAENLIALCPNCHTRFDQKGEIDRKAVRMYKQNLAILNNRYGEFERRIFTLLAKTPLATTADRVFVVGAGGDVLLANAIADGLFEDKKVEGMGLQVSDGQGFSKNFPMSFTFWVTDLGVDFIKRYTAGGSIA
ncbi:HNH endonuclease [Mesorhizobium sp. RIZ17]|uniref:HNH endonuclease n=1 Tax=Mesorhizobium sp. RIZ17 TaxID=3132743 RepID=UPI003DA9274F